MSDIKSAIMDAEEMRIGAGGFGAFSFRDIAAEVGSKSSSAHYHFPTKEDLTAAVIRRYGELVARHLDKELEKNPDPGRVWTKALRTPVFSDDHMCPCTVLAAAAQDLPEAAAGKRNSSSRCTRTSLWLRGSRPTKRWSCCRLWLVRRSSRTRLATAPNTTARPKNARARETRGAFDGIGSLPRLRSRPKIHRPRATTISPRNQGDPAVLCGWSN